MNEAMPIHPAIVHLPLGLAIVMPFLALILYFMIQKGKASPGIWWVPVLLQMVLVLAAVGAALSGHHEEEIVENVMKGSFIEHHEDAAHIFIAMGFVTFLLMAAATKLQRLRSPLMLAGIVLSFVTLGAGMYAGKLGGELVFKHGATKAYMEHAGIHDGESGEQGAGAKGKEEQKVNKDTK